MKERNMLNIVIPLAGRGSRFQKEGFELPKPLIYVHDKHMVQLVINNLRPDREHKFIFLCLEEHIQKYALDQKLKKWADNCEVIIVDQVTEGAACTVLLAKELINNKNPLMIANCDQWVDLDINEYLKFLDTNRLDGLIMTMWADDPKWSYAKLNSDGMVIDVMEKEVISNEATVGIYNYLKGEDFVIAAVSMIEQNIRSNNEFYVAPAYNKMITAGKKIGVYNVGKENDGMYGIGIPSDLKSFVQTGVSRKAINF